MSSSWEPTKQLPAAIDGEARRVEMQKPPEAPTVTFDWGAGGVTRNSRGGVMAGRIFEKALGAVLALLVVGAIAFAFTAIVIWGDPHTYAGMERHNAKDIGAKLMNKYGHETWTYRGASEGRIFAHDAWKLTYSIPGAANKCVFAWSAEGHFFSRLTVCS